MLWEPKVMTHVRSLERRLQTRKCPQWLSFPPTSYALQETDCARSLGPQGGRSQGEMEDKPITHSLARRVHCNFLISQEAMQQLVNQLPKKRLLGPAWDKSSQSCTGRPSGRHTLYHLLLTLTPHKHAERTGFIASGLLPLIHSPYDCQNMLANIQHSAVPVLLLLHNLPWLPRTAGESLSPLWGLEIFNLLPIYCQSHSLLLSLHTTCLPNHPPCHTLWPLCHSYCPKGNVHTFVVFLSWFAQSGLPSHLWQMPPDFSGPSLNATSSGKPTPDLVS